MMKFALALFMVCSANLAFAQSQAQICQRWYSSDIFKTYLGIAIVPAIPGGTISSLLVDTHIPYGIRPLGYDISSLQCSADGMQVKAKSPIANILFLFEGSEAGPDIQNGTLSYIDENGKPLNTINYECSLSAIKSFCAAQTQ